MPKISAVTVHYILRSVEKQTAIPFERLVREMGLEPGLFEEAHAQVDSDRLLQLFRYAVEVSRDPHLALHIGESIPYQSLGLLGYLLVNAGSAAEMLEKFNRYQKLIGRQMKFHLTDEGDAYKMAIYLNENPHTPVPRYHAEVHLSAFLNILRQVSGHRIMPYRIGFSFEAPEDTAAYRGIFGDGLRFGEEENAMILRKADLDFPIQTSNPTMLRFFEAQADALLDEFGRTSWYARVKHVILKNMGNEQVSIADVAEELEVSVRTLQYHLKSESKSYREALNAVRKRVAKHYVENTRMDFSTVSVLLGYAEPSIFFRAFRKWYGATPKAVRGRAGKSEG